jgi:nicotinamidase-related amidase
VAHLLQVSDIERLVMCGQVTEQCIQYSVLDAYLRGYDLHVPRDAVAHINEDWARAALEMMEGNMHAELTGVADGALEAVSR